MEAPTFQQLAKRIDALREDIQFFDTQKKYLAHSDPKEKNSLKEYKTTLRLKAEFLLETINNL